MTGVVHARELTPRGAGAVSVVEYSGDGAIEHVQALSGLARLAVGDLRLARVQLADGLSDEALVVCLAPDRVEIHLHGSPTLVRRACASLATQPAPRRSLEDRAREQLAFAACDAAARILLDQSEGALRRELERIVGIGLDAARAAASELAEQGRRARYALDPARVVLAGPVNAGKSTLFNVLAGATRALVADEPGTTRDVLVADGLLGEWPVRIFDTAGERALSGSAPSHTIEAEGQRRARRAMEAADLVLWLAPLERDPTCAAPPGVVVLHTQADRAARVPTGSISALTEPDRARARVGEVLRAQFDLPADAWHPGLGVPFEPALIELLVQAARGGEDPRALARTWITAC